MSGDKSILLQELCLLINALICFGVPILGIAILRKKYGRVTKPFMIGIAAFVVSQLLLRIPILTYVLPNYGWYLTLQFNPYLYGIFLGLSAGIFEEVARLLFMLLLLKGRTRRAEGFAFGLGHGGIEAILFAGINSVAAMILYPLGQLDLSDSGYLLILAGGYERLFAMAFHVGATLVVLYGIREHKVMRFTLLAILLHCLLDSMLIILPQAIGIGLPGLEIYIMIVSLLVLTFGIWLFGHPRIKIQEEAIL